MTERIRELRDFFTSGEKAPVRMEAAGGPGSADRNVHAGKCTGNAAGCFTSEIYALDNETPVVFKNEQIALTRTIPQVPELYTPGEMEQIRSIYRLHERGEVCNINVDYSMLLDKGFDEKRAEIRTALLKFSKRNDTAPLRVSRVFAFHT